MNTNFETSITKDVLNFSEFLTYTGLSTSYAYKLTSTGIIKHSRPAGKLIFFKKADIDEFLLSNPIKTASEIETEAINYITINK